MAAARPLPDELPVTHTVWSLSRKGSSRVQPPAHLFGFGLQILEKFGFDDFFDLDLAPGFVDLYLQHVHLFSHLLLASEDLASHHLKRVRHFAQLV